MIVERARLSLDADEAQIVTLVRSESGRFAPFELRIGAPRAYVGWLDRSGNPFVPTLLLLAGVVGERLRVEDPISPQLFAGANAASELFQKWWSIAPAALEAEAAQSPRSAGAGTGLFFTRGVDSWFSALRDHSGAAEGKVSHLIYSPDLDGHYSQPTRRRALEATQAAAEVLGLPLIPISHNGRRLLDPFAKWDWTHGGVLAGIGLVLGGYFSRVLIPSSHDLEHLIPWGSHPALDPLWSTERTKLCVDGAEVTRTAKVKAIAKSEFALSSLKVCWHEDINNNCGRCEKCVRTQCAIAIAGAAVAPGVFVEPLSIAAIKRLPPIDRSKDDPVTEPFWEELCESLPEGGSPSDLEAAMRSRLPSWHHLSMRKRNGEPARKIEYIVPAGAAASLLPESMRELLPANGLSTGESHERNKGASAIEITWTKPGPGRYPMPLRPRWSMGLDVLAACRGAAHRPIDWCLISCASRETARLMKRLTDEWGQGVVHVAARMDASGDHGVPRSVASAIERSSRIRVWWGHPSYLDPFLVLESLKHGCLPLQCVPEASHEALVSSLPRGLAEFTLAIPEIGPIPVLSHEEQAARLDRGLSVVLGGSFERDLANASQAISAQMQ